MNSGAYREKITIEQGTVSVDSIGNRTTTWTTFWRGFAYVNMLSGSEYWAAAQVKAEETVQFVLRYSNQLAALSSKGFRVLFRGDALIFDDLRSRSVSMRSVKSGRGVRLDFPDMPYLAIWTPVVDSPFVCLEPWTGMGTRVSEDDRFEHKLGAKILKPGEEQSLAFTITVF